MSSMLRFVSAASVLFLSFGLHATLISPASAQNDEAAEAAAAFLKKLLEDEDGKLAELAEAMLGKNGGDKLFYFPMRELRGTPADAGLKFEDVGFESGDGNQLHAWFMPAAGGSEKAKATIVFTHGNAGNVSYHLGFVSWLPPRGYNVLLFDYRGFGKSTGEVTRRGLVEDVSAAFDYIRTREDIDRSKLVSFSHSIGGTKAITAIALKPVAGLRAVITDSAFSSYKALAAQKAGAVGAKMVSDELAPIGYIDKISPVPLLMIHGSRDVMIPAADGAALFAKAGDPKTFMKVEGGGHENSLERNGGEYREKMLEWLESALAGDE